MNRASAVLERSPREPGADRRRQEAGERDLAVGPGQGAQRAEVRRRPWPRTGRSSRPSTWSGAWACWPAGRASTSRARPAISTPTTPPRARPPIRALDDYDIVCVHVEAPDEASHEGRADAKVEAIERIDRDIVGPVRRALEAHDRWRMVISPDHSTLLRTRAHDRAPVAWAMAGTGLPASGQHLRRSRRPAEPGCPFFDQGYRLMQPFLDLGWDGRVALSG